LEKLYWKIRERCNYNFFLNYGWKIFRGGRNFKR